MNFNFYDAQGVILLHPHRIGSGASLALALQGFELDGLLLKKTDLHIIGYQEIIGSDEEIKNAIDLYRYSAQKHTCSGMPINVQDTPLSIERYHYADLKDMSSYVYDKERFKDALTDLYINATQSKKQKGRTLVIDKELSQKINKVYKDVSMRRDANGKEYIENIEGIPPVINIILLGYLILHTGMTGQEKRDATDNKKIETHTINHRALYPKIYENPREIIGTPRTHEEMINKQAWEAQQREEQAYQTQRLRVPESIDISPYM